MPKTDKTAVEIATGALELIRDCGYSTGAHTLQEMQPTEAGDPYTLYAAFDEVAFGDRNYTEVLMPLAVISQQLGGPDVLGYPETYHEAKVAFALHLRPNEEGKLMPQTQQAAEAILAAAIADLQRDAEAAA